jgi:hypothetical protein
MNQIETYRVIFKTLRNAPVVSALDKLRSKDGRKNLGLEHFGTDFALSLLYIACALSFAVNSGDIINYYKYSASYFMTGIFFGTSSE